ncbi:MAG TPA: GNAT family N-acetyltransferase [Casimicrobiaceae bacterium]|nr:GNAT family N-acetyltransferase [Casimicrobiaceae bacterium]
MTEPAGWIGVDASPSAAIDRLGADLDASLLAAGATLHGDPRWVASLVDGTDKEARFYTLRSAQELKGLAAFFVHPSEVRLALGELALASRPVRRLDAPAAPLVDAGGDRRLEIAQLTALFAGVREQLAPDEVIFLESVAQGTALFDLVAGSRAPVSGFLPLQNGRLYRHRRAAIADSLDGYMKQLVKHTRTDLRSNRKRFAARASAGGHGTRCFRTPDEVPAFVAAAAAVSRKTWQYRLMGAGLRDEQALCRRYVALAQRGWFRSYVLYVGEKPIAFQLGFVYRGRFYSEQMGYDPDWAPHHVGIFLHTEIIADLAASNGAVRELDFGNGDSLYKKRLSTTSEVEGYFYLIPSHRRGRLLVAGIRTTNAVSAVLGAVLGRFGLRTKVRDLMRRLGVGQ